MSGSLGKSENTSQQSFGQNVYGAQEPYLQNLWGGAQGLFNMGMPYAGYNMSKGQNVMNTALSGMQQPWQQQMQGGAYGGLDTTGMVNTAFQDLQNPTSYTQDIYGNIMGGSGNTYADAMKDSLMTDAQRTSDLTMAQLDQRAAGAGMGGSSRHGVAQALALDDINTNLQQNMADIGYSTFDKDLQNKLNIASMADANALAAKQMNMQSAMDLMGGQQGAMYGGLNYGGNILDAGQQMQMLPWQGGMNYANMMGGPIVLGSGVGGSSGKGKSMAGGM